MISVNVKLDTSLFEQQIEDALICIWRLWNADYKPDIERWRHKLRRQQKRVVFGFLALIVLWMLLALNAPAQAPQCPVMPVGLLCISQQAGNVAAENKRELDATKAENVILKQTVSDREADIKKLQDTNTKNVADLTDRIHKTEVDDATKTGQLINAEAEIQRLTAMMQYLLAHGRVRQMGLINLKL